MSEIFGRRTGHFYRSADWQRRTILKVSNSLTSKQHNCRHTPSPIDRRFNINTVRYIWWRSSVLMTNLRISWFGPLTWTSTHKSCSLRTVRFSFQNNKNDNKRRESVTDAVIPLFSASDENHDVFQLLHFGAHHAPSPTIEYHFFWVDGVKYIFFSAELDENDFRQPWGLPQWTVAPPKASCRRLPLGVATWGGLWQGRFMANFSFVWLEVFTS